MLTTITKLHHKNESTKIITAQTNNNKKKDTHDDHRLFNCDLVTSVNFFSMFTYVTSLILLYYNDIYPE